MINDRNMMAALTRRNRTGMAQHLEEKRRAPNPSELLRELASASFQGIMVFGDYNVEFCNERARVLTGVPRSILDEGKPWRDFFQYQLKRGDFGKGPETADFYQDLIRSYEDRETLQVERALVNGRVVRSDRVQNSLGGMTVTLTDITELKAREAELEAISITAQAAEKAKTEFLAKMGHELRTPLNGILGMAEVLSSSGLAPDQTEAASVIYASSEALVRVVEDMVEVSKLDLGTMRLDLRPFDLSQMVRDLVAEFTAAAHARGIGLYLRLSEELPDVVGDGRLLRQAMSHLLDNAVKFTPKGRVDVMLDCDAPSADRLNVTLSVRDTGIGIEQKDQSRIFDRYKQADNGSTRGFDGTGLGLAMARAYAEMMGGSITVDSTFGEGSTFTMTLEFDTVKDPANGDVNAAS